MHYTHVQVHFLNAKSVFIASIGECVAFYGKCVCKQTCHSFSSLAWTRVLTKQMYSCHCLHKVNALLSMVNVIVSIYVFMCVCVCVFALFFHTVQLSDQYLDGYYGLSVNK